jgi:hypothetical protein
LHRWRVILPLPPAKISAIVFDSDCITHGFKPVLRKSRD